jgi:catechol 2,3-dioxygenase-like lactoylglutathione lyase family enzyme
LIRLKALSRGFALSRISSDRRFCTGAFALRGHVVVYSHPTRNAHKMPPMERVTGIGGIFFKASDPDKLKAWYRDHLGVPVGADGYVNFVTKDDPGPYTIWCPFAKDTRYFEPSTAPFMINFRVRDLRTILAQLHAAGANVDEKVDEGEYGKFGWVMDPEGNRVELWEPPPPKG